MSRTFVKADGARLGSALLAMCCWTLIAVSWPAQASAEARSPSTAAPLQFGEPHNFALPSGSSVYEWMRLPVAMNLGDELQFAVSAERRVRFCLIAETDDFGRSEAESACSIPGMPSPLPHIDVYEGEWRKTIDWPDETAGTFLIARAAKLNGSELKHLYSLTVEKITPLPPPAPPPTPAPAPPPPPPPPFAAKLEIARASVLRAQRQLSVLAPITGRASGQVKAAFQAAGRTERFDAEVDPANRRVRFNRAIPSSQARLGTGILTLTYGGDEDTQPQEVRLRAASQPARLDAQRPQIDGGRLTASGEITKRARGVVRLQLLYEPPSEQTQTLEFTAPIRDGRYVFDETLPDDVMADIAQRRGVVHSYTLFTGYFERRVRGEMKSYQVLGPG